MCSSSIWTGATLAKSTGTSSWQVEAVTQAEWDDLIQRLRASHQRVLATMRGYETWDGEENISSAMAMLVHTAYHLGEIRQALCTINRRTRRDQALWSVVVLISSDDGQLIILTRSSSEHG